MDVNLQDGLERGRHAGGPLLGQRGLGVGAVRAQVGLEVALLHELHHHQRGLAARHHAQQPHHVERVEGLHHRRLVQELDALPARRDCAIVSQTSCVKANLKLV